MKRIVYVALVAASVFYGMASVYAETGGGGWLRYARLDSGAARRYTSLPASAIALGDTVVLTTGQEELVRGVKGMLGRTLRTGSGVPTENAIVIGTASQLRNLAPGLRVAEGLRGDAFWLTSGQVGGFHCIIIAGGSDRGVLYGVFAFLSRIARQMSISALNELQKPSAAVRWANQWDNLDGSIERGYGGRSIFFDKGSVRPDLTRAAE